MVFLQIDLTGTSAPVRDRFKQFTYVETEPGSDVIIIDATTTQVGVALRDILRTAASMDSDYVTPSSILEVEGSVVINGKPLIELMQERWERETVVA